MIVVTTPTGTIGSQVLARLLDAGAEVRVIVREPARLDRRVHDLAEIVQGSHGEPDAVNRAFEGATAVFWVPPTNPQAKSLAEIYADFAAPARAALGMHRVSHVVGVSALGRHTALTSNAGLVSASLAMDDLFVASGVNYRALVMPSFMDNMLRQADVLRQRGEFYWPGPAELRAPTCATKDIADMAAGLLLDRDWSGHGEQPVLGPEDLSQLDLARIMSEVLQRPIAFRELTTDAFEAMLLQRGMSPDLAKGYADMMSAKSRGLDNGVRRTSMNTTGTTFRQWCSDVLKPAVEARGD